MKFRRGIAKLLVAVTIVELILSSINRNEYMVMAATDEGVQSEAIVEQSADEIEDVTGENANAAEPETVDSVAEGGAEDTADVTTESTAKTVIESTAEDTTENSTESTAEDTTENSTESTVEDITENTTESATKDTTENTTENNTEDTTKNTTESTTEDTAEDVVKDVTESENENAADSTSKDTNDSEAGEGKENTTETTAESKSEDAKGDTTESVSEEETKGTTESSTINSAKEVVQEISNNTFSSVSEQMQESIENDGIELLSENEEISLGTPSIPASVEELNASTTKYSISNYQDWLNLQKLSQESTLDGYSFEILVRTENGTNKGNYNFTELNSYLESTGADPFTGLGSAEKPFEGTLYGGYTTGITLKMDVALFNYLSTKANLNNLLIEPQGANAGLADHLIVNESTFGNLSSIKITADGSGITGEVVGGLFANVENKTDEPFVLQGTDVIVNSAVSGSEIAGGIIGSMEGSITMVMDGEIQSAPSVEATGASGTTGTVGGWIGTIDAGDAGNKGKITIQSGNAAEIAYTFQGKRSYTARNAGGLFGQIANAEINVESKLTINKSSLEPAEGSGEKYFDLSGNTAGSFAGEVDNSTINLKANVKINQVRIKQGDISSIQTDKGIGGFIGVLKNSTIDSNGNGTLTVTGVSHWNLIEKSILHNVGGIVGYAYNSYFLFTGAEAVVENFTSRKTYGNVAGAIGLYEADEKMGTDKTVVIQRISVRGTTKVAAASGKTSSGTSMSGNAAGLIGRMDLTDCEVTVTDCYGESLCYSTSSGARASLGIGTVASNKSSAKLYLTGIVLTGNATENEISADGWTYHENFGGMICYADIDLEIAGEVDENGNFDTAVRYTFSDKNQDPEGNYFGGLIGAVCQSGTEYREVDVSNVLVGTTYFKNGIKSVLYYGGLFGKVEDRTSVCLDEKIYLNSGKAINWKQETITVGKQIPLKAANYMGSVVGSQNYSLLYLQPTADLQVTEYGKMDEVGNYGGIFRNGNWDGECGYQPDANGNSIYVPTNNSDPNTWLIQNHEVTGYWKCKELSASDDDMIIVQLEIKTMGDIMRLAIFGNTHNLTGGAATEYQAGDGFYPLEIQDENGNNLTEVLGLGRVTGCNLIRVADFYLESGTYDLGATGIVSLYRNDIMGVEGKTTDNEGITRLATGTSYHSLICEDDNGATIKYSLTNYGHDYVGLFPWANGYLKTIEFKNLNLEYTINLNPIQYGYDASQTWDKSITQFVGGLAGKAAYAVNMSNVAYTGEIIDNKNPDSNFRNTGGLFGYYIGTNTQTLTIDGLTADFNCTYMHRNNTVSAVIAKIEASNTNRCNVTIRDINVSGSIQAYVANTSVALQQSGLITTIAYIGNSNAIYSNFDISDVTINNFSMGVVTSKLATTYPAIGGFLGYSWNCVKVNLKDINVGTDIVTETGTATGSATINAKVESFGGLVHDVRGKMLVDTMNYGKGTSIDTHGAGDICGLLVKNGRYLYLDLANYSIEDGVTLKNYAGEFFDEIVGWSKGGDSDEKGGIVSISTGNSNSYLGKTTGVYDGAAYTSYGYGNHLVDQDGNYIKLQNPYTRYYYDLDELDFGVDYQIIKSAEDLMVWHIMHYANAYIVDNCFQAWPAAHTSDALPTGYEISGTIDMTGYSIYPTTLFQGETYNAEGAKIILNAQAIYDGEDLLNSKLTSSDGSGKTFVVKYPQDYKSQHYQMHAGLFNNIYSGVTVNGLTLSGTYSLDKYYGSDTYTAGALVCGKIYGVELEETDSQGQTLYDEEIESNFNNITLSNLWCVSNQGRLKEVTSTEGGTSGDATTAGINLSNPIGLMIAGIASGANVNMDGIYMRDYVDQDVADGYKAASALIGMVGDEEATYISLTFKNMDIMDAAANRSDSNLKSSKCDEALARASLIYYYNYQENCSAIYTFTSKDYLVGKLGVKAADYDANYIDAGVVTLGQELGKQSYELTAADGSTSTKTYAEILYYDNEDPVGKASEWLTDSGEKTTNAVEITFDCDNYLPYVCYRVQDILVNPKIANIEYGCGTYEDPYIVSSTTQLITLYRYLYEEDLYKEVLGMSGNEWKIHATGDGTDDYRCNGTEYDDYYGNKGHGELLEYEKERSANSNFPTQEELSQAYYKITGDIDLSKYTEFAGFGREDMPFLGVFIGGTAEGTANPTITMVDAASSTLSQYAFIQVAKGVVVKDLTFLFGSTIKINSNTGGIAAGVMATVAGGDNIIDNVKVTSAENSSCFTIENEATVIGGYVGVVELGGVVLRNMNDLSVDSGLLSGFSVSASGTKDYPYVGSIIGRVLDGYVVYDGQVQSDTPLFENMGIASGLKSGTLPLCSTYNIINGAYLTGSAIEWTGKGFNIADHKGLQIISMALNSGMLNYGATDSDGNYYGYGSDSRQRNGNYNYVGQIDNDTAIAAYQDVTAGDNVSTFEDSYLWQYFTDISTDSNMKAKANNCGLNPILITGEYTTVNNPQTGGTETIDTSSDMLTYTLTGAYYNMSVFGMGFRGLGARYHCDEYSKYSNNNSVSYLEDTTLLFKSNLVGTNANNLATIELNMVVTNAMDSRRAGLLNEAPNNSTWHTYQMLIQNIRLKGKVTNEGLKISQDNTTYYKPDVSYNAGGFMSDAVTQTRFDNVKLEDLTVEATGYAGGLIGHVKEVFSSNVNVQSVELNGLTVAGGWDCDEDGNTLTGGIIEGHAGGLIGLFESGRGDGSYIRIGTAYGENQNVKGVDGHNVIVYTRGRNSAAGGLVGYIYMSRQTVYNPCYIYNVGLRNLSVYTANTYLMDKINDWEIKGWAGGIVGYVTKARLNLDRITIGSESSEETVFIALNGGIDTKGNPVSVSYNTSGAGGFVGQSHADGAYLNITNSVIQGTCNDSGIGTTTIQGSTDVAGVVGKADIGTVQNCDVKGVSFVGVFRTGGCVGSIETGYGAFTLDDVEVTDCNFKGASPVSGDTSFAKDAGYFGGLVARVKNDQQTSAVITDCKVTDCVFSPDYSRFVGGFVGLSQSNQSISISGTNTVSRNVICGDIAGGVFGYYCTTGIGTGMSNITISDNRIVSCSENLIEWIQNSHSQYLAGGFAGLIDTSAEMAPIENLVIENNVISGFNTSTDGINKLSAGGVVGRSDANAYFYNVRLKNNYIGVFEDADILNRAKVNWDNVMHFDPTVAEAVKISYYLEKTDLSILATLLCAKTAPNATDSELEGISNSEMLKNPKSEDLYRYSYDLGAVAGKLSSSNSGRVNTFVQLNVQYDNNQFRPVSDVGMIATISSTSGTAEMYEKYRAQYDIVYDSMTTENAVDSTKYAGFANLDLIYEKYQQTDSVDRRYAYRLDQNYLKGESSDISISTIYNETYKKGENYISDFVTEDNKALPLVVFRTTDNGSLDDVIQTYINMLTNNSGALNTYDQQDIQVTTTRARLIGGLVIEDPTSTPASVQVIQNGNKFEFVNTIDEDGDGTREKHLYDQMTDAKNVSFTVITISYMYGDEAKWELKIPVYVEQELEFDSHMRFVKDIEYNVNTVKKGDGILPDSDTTANLDSGASFTLYLEYVYGEARTRYPNAEIPKKLIMESPNSISFLKGTQMTLIDLEDGGTPYYYTINGSEGNEIDFTNFIASDGKTHYSVKNINDCTEYVDEPFIDVCGIEKKNVGVENYLLLVDTSNVDQEVKSTRGNANYTLRTDFSQLEETDSRLYSRIEYTEHCIVGITETMGMSCKFIKDDIYKVVEGEISENETLALTLKYDVTLSDAWKKANADSSVYLDVAISLQKTVNNSTQDISLPVGTQVYFETPVVTESGETVYERSNAVYVVQGEGISDVYYYAYSNQEVDVLKEFGTGEDADNTRTIRVVLDFSSADLKSFENESTEGDYGISADLLVCTDKKNPINGEVRDTFSAKVIVNVATELGFALQTDDLLYQGVNRYQSGETDTGIISFKAKVALPSDFTAKDLEGKFFSFVYQIEEKTTRQSGTDTPEYKPYTGNKIKIYHGEDVTNLDEDLDTATYTDSNGIKLRCQYCSLSYDEGAIPVTDNVAEASFILEAKEDVDFSNYRVTGYLVISDEEIESVKTVLEDSSELNSDCFVYTVAKVKTELD